jgi:HK97 family phage major capsid protein
VLSSLPAAFWVNGDSGLKQTTKLEWKNKYLIAEELAVIVPLPEAVLDDAEYDIWGEAKPLLAEAFGIKIDQAVFFGAGGAPADLDDSVVEHANAAGNVYVRGSGGADQDVAEDVNQTMALVEDDGFDVNGFAARRGLKAAFRGLRDKNGGLLFQPSLQAGTPSTLYGENISFASPNGAWERDEAELIAGDFSKGIIGVRQDITYKLFTEGVISDEDGKVVYNLMQQDGAALRAVMRIGWAIANPINRENEIEADRSPFAVLQPEDYGAS